MLQPESKKGEASRRVTDDDLERGAKCTGCGSEEILERLENIPESRQTGPHLVDGTVNFHGVGGLGGFASHRINTAPTNAKLSSDPHQFRFLCLVTFAEFWPAVERGGILRIHIEHAVNIVPGDIISLDHSSTFFHRPLELVQLGLSLLSLLSKIDFLVIFLLALFSGRGCVQLSGGAKRGHLNVGASREGGFTCLVYTSHFRGRNRHVGAIDTHQDDDKNHRQDDEGHVVASRALRTLFAAIFFERITIRAEAAQSALRADGAHASVDTLAVLEVRANIDRSSCKHCLREGNCGKAGRRHNGPTADEARVTQAHSKLGKEVERATGACKGHNPVIDDRRGVVGSWGDAN